MFLRSFLVGITLGAVFIFAVDITVIEAPRALARGFFGFNSFNPPEAERLSIHSRLKNRGFLRRRNKNLNVKGVFIKATPTLLPTATLTPTETPTSTETITPSPKPTITPTPTPNPTATPKPTAVPATSEQLEEWFEKYSSEYSVSKDKLRAIAVCESNLKTNAVNGDYAGLYQFSKNAWLSTRKAMNLESDLNLRFNPEESIKTAAFKIAGGGIGSWPNCGK